MTATLAHYPLQAERPCPQFTHSIIPTNSISFFPRFFLVWPSYTGFSLRLLAAFSVYGVTLCISHSCSPFIKAKRLHPKHLDLAAAHQSINNICKRVTLIRNVVAECVWGFYKLVTYSATVSSFIHCVCCTQAALFPISMYRAHK